jgi:hypothetical protein
LDYSRVHENGYPDFPVPNEFLLKIKPSTFHRWEDINSRGMSPQIPITSFKEAGCRHEFSGRRGRKAGIPFLPNWPLTATYEKIAWKTVHFPQPMTKGKT